MNIFCLHDIDSVLDAGLDVIEFELRIIVADDSLEWNRLANQFQNGLDGDTCA